LALSSRPQYQFLKKEKDEEAERKETRTRRADIDKNTTSGGGKGHAAVAKALTLGFRVMEETVLRFKRQDSKGATGGGGNKGKKN